MPQLNFNESPWLFADAEFQDILKKVDLKGEELSNVLFLGKGMETGRNNVFGKLTIEQIKKWGLNQDQYYFRVRNSDISSYYIKNCGEVMLYLEDAGSFNDLPEGVKSHLKNHEDELKKRAAYQRGDCEWWKYTWPRLSGRRIRPCSEPGLDPLYTAPENPRRG